MGVTKSFTKYALDTDLILKADLESPTGYVRPSQLPPITPQQQNGSYIVNGGKVAYLNTAYQFRVSPCQYVVQGARYYSQLTDIALSASHATFNRFDIIAVNTGQQVVVIEGTAAANPSTPDFDALSGIALSTILVVANSTTPYGNTSIYLNNSEWTSSVNGNIVANSTNTPFAGAQCIEATAAAAAAYVRLTNSTTISLASMKQLTLMIKSKAAWPSQKSLRLTWYSGSAKIGQTVQLSNGRYGFVDSNILTYQLVVIPITDFLVPNTSTVDRLEILINGNGTTVGFFIDNILLEPNSAAVETVTTLSASQLTGPYATAGMTMSGPALLGRVSGNGPAQELTPSSFFLLNSGTIDFGGVLPGIVTSYGANVILTSAFTGSFIDVTRGLNTQNINNEKTFTFSGTPYTGQWFSTLFNNIDGTAHLLTIPTGYSISQAGNISQVIVPPNGKLHLTWRYDGTGYTIYGDSAVNTQASTGKQTIFIPAAAMIPAITDGCSGLRSLEITSSQPNVSTVDFDGDIARYAQFSIGMPKSWNEGTLQAEFYWSHRDSGTEFGTVWGIQAVAVSHDDTIAASWGTAQIVMSSGLTPNKLYRSSGTPAVTVAGTPATGDLTFFRVYRDPAATLDTYTGAARLHGIKLYYTTDAANDI